METKLVEMMMRVYYWMKGAAYFWLGWLAGLGLFGTMASLTALTEAHQNAKWRADLLTFSNFWDSYKANRRDSWGLNLFYTLLSIFLCWLIFITSQMRGLIFLVALVIQVTVLVLVNLALVAESQMRVVYQGEASQFIKFSFFQLLVTPRPNLLTLVYSLVIIWVVMTFPALAFIFAVPLWVTSLSSFYLREWRRQGVIPHEPEEESQSL